MYKRINNVLGELIGSSRRVLATIAVAGSKSYGDTVAVVDTFDQVYVAWFEGDARGDCSPYVKFVEEVTLSHGVTPDRIQLVEASCLADLIVRVCEDPQLVSDQFADKFRELEDWNLDGCARRAAVTGRSQKMCPQGYIEWLRGSLADLAVRGFNPRGFLIDGVTPLSTPMGRRAPTRPLVAPSAPRG